MLAGVAAVVVVLGLAGFLGLRAIAGGSASGQAPLPRFGGLDYAPTITADATMIARARTRAASGLAILNTASATTPVFSDPLKTNAQHWPIGNTHFSFGPDGKLHATNPSSASIAALNQPVSPPTNFLVSVNMTFLKGSNSDVAGLTVRVVPGGSGGASRYLMLLAPEGRFEVWYYDGATWTGLASGYSSAIKPGLDVSNRLEVLCATKEIWFFVNGQFLTNVFDATLANTPNTLGPVVVYTSTEVAYDTYDVYAVGA
jgi:hypothetical protein